MTRYRTALTVAAVLLVSSAAVAFQAKPVDVTGTWSGTFTMTRDGQTREQSAHMVFKQAGEAVTGTAGPDADRQMPFAKGKVTTVKGVTTVTFEVADGPNPIAFDLKLVEGRLKGTAKGQDGERQMSAEVNVGRAK
jgi:hypothetical protein